MNEEQRQKLRKLQQEIKQRNEDRTGGQGKFFLESTRRQTEEVVHKEEGIKEKKDAERNVTKEKREEFKIMYTNVDGIISRKLELRDYLENKTPNLHN